MRFSQRHGVTPVQKIIQIDSMDDDLRNSLWNLLSLYYWDRYRSFHYAISTIKNSNFEKFFYRLWLHFLKKPIDTIPEYYIGHHSNSKDGKNFLRNFFFAADWFEVYDFIEFVYNFDFGRDVNAKDFLTACNQFLENENSGFRLVNGGFVPITSADEINEIEDAIKNATPYGGAKEHLNTAISLLSDKENPDYRNSIKESISAVESLCKAISRDESGTLGTALNILGKGDQLHPALVKAYKAIYGYSSDADGIRHGLMDQGNIIKAEARFMLISCSAFVNYVIDTMNEK